MCKLANIWRLRLDLMVVGVSAAICGGMALFHGGMQQGDANTVATQAAALQAYRRPHAIPEPPNDPSTPAKVALGKALFFDKHLSGSGAMSCASCHDPALGWQDKRPRAIGDTGAVLRRRTPTILNVAWVEPLFWDGRAESLEEQAKGPLADPLEMNMPLSQVVATVRKVPEYRAMFTRAYAGRTIDIATIAAAISAFERTQVSEVAPFDRWVAGDETAISPAARRGFQLFTTGAGCSTCHSGWRFTDDGFHDIGLPGTDLGRGEVLPEIPTLAHTFKTPTLRDIAQRGPYMHDGSIATLTDVIDYYDRAPQVRRVHNAEIRPLQLTNDQKRDLLAFLQSLSGDTRVSASP